MKSVLKKIFIFLVLVIVIDQFGGYALERINQGTVKGDYGRNNYIATQANQDILIFGSSRAIHHYDPTLISDKLGMSCYNCGEDGMGIILMYARFQLILQRHTPKIVIYDIEPEYDLLENDNTRYIGFLRPYYDNEIVQSICCDVDPSERFKTLSRLYRFNSRFIDIVSQRISRSPSLAKDFTWSPLTKTLNQEPKPRINADVKLSYDTLKLKCFRQLIDICHTKNIKLILSVSPIYRDFDESIMTSLKSFSTDCQVPLFYHYTDTTFTHHRELFSDPGHLNESGATLLTHKIIGHIKDILK